MCCFYYNKAGELANKGAFNWNAPLFLPSWPVAALGSHDDQRTAQSISLASGLTCITARGLHEAGPWLAETRLSIWPWGVGREGLLNYLKYPLWIGCHPRSSTVRRGSITRTNERNPKKNARERASYFTLLQPPNLAEFCPNLQPPRGHVTAIRRHWTLRLLLAQRPIPSR